MPRKAVLAIDQGTTGSRAVVFDQEGNVLARAYREIRGIYPNPGWVEQDPREYLRSVRECILEALQAAGPDVDIEAVGITNQRETTVAWDRRTGEPVSNAIVWQCRRTAPYCERFLAQGLEPRVTEKTGLRIDPYFSATKILWILDHVPEARVLAGKGQLAVGTVDSWLMWWLSGGRAHVTDISNASRTLLLNIHTGTWDPELLELFGVPQEILPAVQPSGSVFCEVSAELEPLKGVPVAGVAGDQHAALFGQTCFEPGMAKNTYGTALAVMMNTGTTPVHSSSGLTTDLAWKVQGRTEYSLEGVVFIGGAAVQWLRDGIKVVQKAAETEPLARSVDDTGGVYFVPAFVGLCAPYWDMYARGTIVGITHGTTEAHLARATLESIAYQTRDNVDAMARDLGRPVPVLRVDGGATRNEFLMQFQADILGLPVERAANLEMAAQGAAFLAGLSVGTWASKEELSRLWKCDRVFEPAMSEDRREELYAGWKAAVERSRGWAQALSQEKPTSTPSPSVSERNP